MARFVDLEKTGDAHESTSADNIRRQLQLRVVNGYDAARSAALAAEMEPSTENRKPISNPITDALSCYPYVYCWDCPTSPS